MTRLIISILLSTFLFCALPIKAQTKDQLYYHLETGITQAGGEHAPLWLTANKYGLSSITKNNGYVLAGIIQPLKGNERFSYGYGLELATAWNFTSSFIVQQAYLDLKWNRFTLSIGSKERAPEFANPELSSGALTLSGNARPIPQVCIGIDDYYTVPHTNNWLAIRGHFAYGRFTDDNWQKSFANAMAKRTRDVLYHSKAFYFRIGNTQKFPMTFEGGLQMETEFGGKQYRNGQVTKFPSKLRDYFEVIIPSAGGSDSPVNDQENIEGNITGSWHAAITYYANNWKLRGYYEHYFEDHSMLAVDYPWIDGLYAVELTLPKNPFVSQILYEYMCSRDQTSPTPDKPSVSVCDNYYNHSMYTGWQHWGMGLGNPLLISPIYNTNGEIYFYDNRVIANHFGITGNPTSEISYRLKFSLSRNFGTYSRPYPKKIWQSYTLAEICYTPTKIPGWQFTASYGTDHGKITGNNHGCMITIRKTGLIK
ncbi:MAG: capsule assembly Wzi family protein [Bacteroides sp.]|jgi:hypothetical protein|nr:capsule assembly Wzi family protein [Bacteroides sp.]MCI1684082.1 capsule assembly Wzi family protein [Bacteroides sp.]